MMWNKPLLGAMLAGLVAVGVCADDIKLANSDFAMKDGKLGGWGIGGKVAEFTVTSEPVKPGDDDLAVVLSATKETNQWYNVFQRINLTDLPKTEAGQKLKITLKYDVKAENVKNGAFATIAFFKDKARVFHRDDKKVNGSCDWTERKFVVATAVPEGATAFQISFYLGRTAGKAYFADPELEIDVVK